MTREAAWQAVSGAIAELAKLSAENIAENDDLADDLGVDSMMAVSLWVAIEDRLGMALPDGCEASLVSARTVGSLVDRVVHVFRDLGDSAP